MLLQQELLELELLQMLLELRQMLELLQELLLELELLPMLLELLLVQELLQMLLVQMLQLVFCRRKRSKR